MTRTIRVAALQLNTKLGDTQHNLAASDRLAREALNKGAKWIALPEFFNTGVCWDPKLVNAIENDQGSSIQFMKQFSEQHNVLMGGSLLYRTPNGSVRNRYFAFENGSLIGTHDKDYPTMWENAFYEGGAPDDDGVLGNTGDIRLGTAVCWEFLRTGTARRLRGKVDAIIGGTHWWSLPTNWPTFLQRSEAYNEANSLLTVQETAKLIGVPVLNASHCNTFSCRMPGMLSRYDGHLEGNTAIIDAKGNLLGHRDYTQGEGVVMADIAPEATPVQEPVPSGFWLRKRGFLPTFAWHYQRWLGQKWYRKHVLNNPTDTNAHSSNTSSSNTSSSNTSSSNNKESYS